MKLFRKSQQLRKHLESIDTKYSQNVVSVVQALVVLAEIQEAHFRESLGLLNRIARAVEARSPHRRGKPTEWQLFMSKGMRAGKSIQQIAAEWRARA